MVFKKIRSFVGKLFDEHHQMIIILWLSNIFWNLRKYFLGVEIEYPQEFKDNWNFIKNYSSQDKERNFTLYQMIKIHNKFFENKFTNVIEFGTDRGGALTTLSKFIKKNSKLYAVDSFGFYSDDIKKNVSKFDEHYQGSYKPFTKKTRFKKFDYKLMNENLNKILSKKNSSLETIVGFFPNLEKEKMEKIEKEKFSFVHLDFDLYQSTIDCLDFLKDRLEKNAIVLVDDFNFINQEGVKKAFQDLEIDLNKGIQTQSGQLILFN